MGSSSRHRTRLDDTGAGIAARATLRVAKGVGKAVSKVRATKGGAGTVRIGQAGEDAVSAAFNIW